jgi:cytochrome d ubiquinol oxidase subunit I
MIYAWGGMMLYAILGVYFLWRKTLEKQRWFLWLSPPSIFLPYIANLAGWFTAETGRQPWIVQDVMRTADGLSKVVSVEQIIASLVMFVTIFSLLFILFIFLLNRKVQHGPVHVEEDEGEEITYRDPYQIKR